ncbi:L,D-transpeptidase family protein [Janibacter limosus]|uniref:L,D-transpeptidase family protein n=1 Tax=Janibacter limosus TaxID=53458 RepID=UPI000833224D|nr:L,D-transpeptidase family protein [Janibacter limosus]
MSTYEARHAMLDVEPSPHRRLLMRGGLATAAATAVGGVGFLTPAVATSTTADRATAYRRTLKVGSTGLAVASLQRRLLANGYWHSGADGEYGQTTQQAVMALQKVHGLTRDGVCGPATWTAFENMYRPRGRTTSGTVMEVDLTKQLIIFVVGGQTKWVMNTSTGKSGWRTPPGRFQIFRSVNRMDYGPLGALWRPRYFNRGIAIHGSPSIPGYPASHGCTRVSNAAVNYVWSAGLAPIGRKVWVY